jgi:hypothetical protein
MMAARKPKAAVPTLDGAPLIPPPAAEPEGVVVEVDTLIERPDLGPTAATFVAAGDPVPTALADFPRRPA